MALEPSIPLSLSPIPPAVVLTVVGPNRDASAKFPKRERLRGKKRMEKLFAEGKGTVKFPIKLIYLPMALPEETAYQAAMAVPKRNFKKAVHRNRIKRLMREAYRHHKPPFPNNSDTQYAFLFLYLGKRIPNPAEIENGIVGAIQAFADREGMGNRPPSDRKAGAAQDQEHIP